MIVLISYGQILRMGIWKDDNAIFFKFTHINEPAGFFGRGILGEGYYKFSVTPYYFIYKLFGYNSTFPYYLLLLIFYFLLTFLLYKVFSYIFSEWFAKVASFLFAAGYIGAEGFYWISNSMLAMVSMFFGLLVLYFYYKYFKKRRLLFYLLSIAFYWLMCFLVPLRSIYYISIIILFEFFFTSYKNKIKSLISSIARLIPFLYIFYDTFLNGGGDGRLHIVKDFFMQIIRGNFFVLQNLISSVSVLVFPDWISHWFLNLQKDLVLKTGINFPYLLTSTLAFFIVLFFLIFKNSKKNNLLTFSFCILAILWTAFSKGIFSSPVLNISVEQLYITRLGGFIILLAFAIFIKLEKVARRNFSFFALWFGASIINYAIYDPLSYFETTHRYWSHSLVPLVGIFAVIYVVVNVKSDLKSKLVKTFIIGWGLTNLVTSVVYLHSIVVLRSIPVKNFYIQMKEELNVVKKGDVFYFDVANDSRSAFRAAFTVSSMPNETAIAWRYGIDRDDIKLFENFNDFIKWVKTNNITSDHIHTFFYSNNQTLVDTTSDTENFLLNNQEIQNVDSKVEFKTNELIITPTKPIVSITPVLLKLDIKASLTPFERIKFPLVSDQAFVKNNIVNNINLRNETFDYLNKKDDLIKNSVISVNNNWFGSDAKYLIDGDRNTAWRGNRILWGENREASLVLDMQKLTSISRFIWFNAYASDSPTKYFIEVSQDGKTWKQVYSYSNTQRIEPDVIQDIRFAPVDARQIKMVITQTINDDSPGLSEIWAVPSAFDNLDVGDMERFLTNPLGYVPNLESYMLTLKLLNYKDQLSLYWKDDESEEWKTSFESKADIIYDSATSTYEFTVPAGGTNIKNIKLTGGKILGDIITSNLRYRHFKESEIVVK